MCELSFTYHGCRCLCYHATLPCPKAFDPSLPKCNPADYTRGEKVEGDCPECKPAFDNKSGRKPRIKLNFTRKPEEATMAKIDQQHNQFRHLDPQERYDHRSQLFLDWLDHPQHPGDYDPPLGSHAMSTRRRQALRARRDNERHKITPSPPPTPPATMTQTTTARVRDEYILKARTHHLDAGQQEVFRRSGYGTIRRLSVISRKPITQDSDTSQSNASHEYTLDARRHTLSASQRAALRGVGLGHLRRLSIVGPRRCRPSPN